MESLIAFKRAGADGVLTYFAPSVAEKLKREFLMPAVRLDANSIRWSSRSSATGAAEMMKRSALHSTLIKSNGWTLARDGRTVSDDRTQRSVS